MGLAYKTLKTIKYNSRDFVWIRGPNIIIILGWMAGEGNYFPL